MDDIKLFAKNEKQQETLIHTVRIYSQDIGMEFGIEKCTMLLMKSCKRLISNISHEKSGHGYGKETIKEKQNLS